MDDAELRNNFSWKEAEKMFDWKQEDPVNMAYLSCDRWARGPERIAIYWEDETGAQETWTFHQLKEKSDRMANALHLLEIKKGDRVAGLLGKDLELIVTILAVWKIGAIYVPLFTAFETDAIMHRLQDSGTCLVVTNKKQKKKFADEVHSFQFLSVDQLMDNGKSFWEWVESFSKDHQIEPTTETDPAIIQYTSGTTGLAKGAVLKHKSPIALYPYMKYAINLQEDDIFFGGADLGWSYGLLPCTFSPLSFGVSIVYY